MISILILLCSFHAWPADEEIQMSEEAKKTDHDKDAFGPDPSYEEKPYDIEAQLAIYGGKYKVKTARPLFELGDRLYWDGPVPLGGTPFGEKNPNAFWLMAFGDWRTAVGYNNKDNKGEEFARLATRINLDFDMRLTSTERIHSLITPLDRDGKFTRVDFAIPGDEDDSDSEFEGDVDVDTLFFEGDFGPIFAGMSGHENNLDLPFSFGLVPMFTQNGIWVEDAFTGFAITPFSARNSPGLGISNFDITFYAGFDRVSTPAVVDQTDVDNNSEKNTRMFGAFGFAEANRGYWEFGYGYVDSEIDGLSYHNVTLAHTRRIRHRLSNSVRVIGNFGQEGQLISPLPELDERKKTADGILLLIENSLITSKPSTLVPYFNLFVGFDSPQALARDPGAGGVLKNTGLNFEGDALTAMPKLNADANNTFGGAIGVQYLFNLNQQLVVEVATVIPHGSEKDRVVKENQYGIDVRYQRPITNAWIIRADVMKGFGKSEDTDELFGVRLEFRRKF